MNSVNNILIKYRPQTFEDLLGNKAAKRVINRMFSRAGIPAGFLLTGPYGCGKTTLAYLVTRTIRCEQRDTTPIGPCNSCSYCIQPLDAGVFCGDGTWVKNCAKLSKNELLEMLDKCKYGHDTIVIYLDEVHRASRDLQHLLLTHLEDPRENAVLLLSTRDPEDIEEALVQRLIHLHLAPPPADELVRLLKRVCKAEGFDVPDEHQLTELCRRRHNVPRDCLKGLLEEDFDAPADELTNVRDDEEDLY